MRSMRSTEFAKSQGPRQYERAWASGMDVRRATFLRAATWLVIEANSPGRERDA